MKELIIYSVYFLIGSTILNIIYFTTFNIRKMNSTEFKEVKNKYGELIKFEYHKMLNNFKPNTLPHNILLFYIRGFVDNKWVLFNTFRAIIHICYFIFGIFIIHFFNFFYYIMIWFVGTYLLSLFFQTSRIKWLRSQYISHTMGEKFHKINKINILIQAFVIVLYTIYYLN